MVGNAGHWLPRSSASETSISDAFEFEFDCTEVLMDATRSSTYCKEAHAAGVVSLK